ncbi:hypothetical protein DICVIV_02314 [Dictyocaulus viviparus]|uniref:Regulatory protein zeste n=1 Tax=Dictyocaulus viviparus TaxID=29172 RepID=A0A0D8YA78_DICVI|nr:hypothetical protein DICVIV_02314 [Dictyocaulus viviparus]
MSNSLRVKVDERLDIARLVEQHKTVLFNPELSEEQKTEAWSRILTECTIRGHHWVKGKDVTYLKKSKWPGIKRDAIEHYQADMKGSFADKEIAGYTAVNERHDNDVTQPVTVEVKTGKPLDFLACGLPLTEDVDKFDNGLFINLFSKSQHESRKTPVYSVDQEQRYTKRQRVDDDGPIDHDLMAALGFGKHRQRNTDESSEQDVRKLAESDTGGPDCLTTIGDYLRSVTALSAPVKEGSTVLLHSPNVIERKPSVENSKGVMSLQKVATLNSTSTITSPKESCRDLKNLQKKAMEAQIAREEAMTKYYQLKLKKLELEIAELQRNKSENEACCHK